MGSKKLLLVLAVLLLLGNSVFAIIPVSITDHNILEPVRSWGGGEVLRGSPRPVRLPDDIGEFKKGSICTVFETGVDHVPPGPDRRRINIACSEDNMQTWKFSVASPIDNSYSARYPALAADNDYIYIVYSWVPLGTTTIPTPPQWIMFQRYDDSGQWSAQTLLSNPGFLNFNSQPDIEIGKNGDVYVAWSGDNGGSNGGNKNWINFISSTSQGSIWNPIIYPWPSPGNQYNPELVVSSTGLMEVIHLAWSEDSGGGPPQNIWYSQSMSGGMGWGPTIPLTFESNPGALNDAPSMVVLNNTPNICIVYHRDTPSMNDAVRSACTNNFFGIPPFIMDVNTHPGSHLHPSVGLEGQSGNLWATWVEDNGINTSIQGALNTGFGMGPGWVQFITLQPFFPKGGFSLDKYKNPSMMFANYPQVLGSSINIPWIGFMTFWQVIKNVTGTQRPDLLAVTEYNLGFMNTHTPVPGGGFWRVIGGPLLPPTTPTIDTNLIVMGPGNRWLGQFEIIFNADFSLANWQTDVDKLLVTGLDNVDGIDHRVYRLFVPDNGFGGVICPHATSLTDINLECHDKIPFTHAQALAGDIVAGYKIKTDGTYYSVTGEFPGTGLGSMEPAADYHFYTFGFGGGVDKFGWEGYYNPVTNEWPPLDPAGWDDSAAFGAPQYGNVADNDGSYEDYSSTIMSVLPEPVWEIMKFEFDVDEERENLTSLLVYWNGRASRGVNPVSDANVYLLLWNLNTASWDAVDAATGGECLMKDCSLAYTIPQAKILDYVDTDGKVSAMVVNWIVIPGMGMTTLYTDESLLLASFVPGGGEEAGDLPCVVQGGEICTLDEYCSLGWFIAANDTDRCCLEDCLSEPRADLDIGLSVPDPLIEKGAMVPVSVNVENIGDLNAGDFNVALWTQSPFSLLGEKRINGLDPAENASLKFNFDSNAFDGLVNLEAMADYSREIVEQDENNNNAVLEVFVKRTVEIPDENEEQIDLLALNAYTDKPTVMIGEPLTVTAIVLNAGNTASGSFIVGLYAEDTFSPPLTEQNIAGLGAEETVEVSFTIDTVDLMDGVTLILFSDSFREIVETDETNNQRILDVRVQGEQLNVEFDDYVEVGELQTFLVTDEKEMCVVGAKVEVIPPFKDAPRKINLTTGEDCRANFKVNEEGPHNFTVSAPGAEKFYGDFDGGPPLILESPFVSVLDTIELLGDFQILILLLLALIAAYLTFKKSIVLFAGKSRATLQNQRQNAVRALLAALAFLLPVLVGFLYRLSLGILFALIEIAVILLVFYLIGQYRKSQKFKAVKVKR